MKLTITRTETNRTHCRGYMTADNDENFRIETLEGAHPDNDKYIGKCLPIGMHKGEIVYTTIAYRDTTVISPWPQLTRVEWFPKAQIRRNGIARKGNIVIGTEATEFEIKGGDEATIKLARVLKKAFDAGERYFDLEIKVSDDFIRNDYTLDKWNRRNAAEEERRLKAEAQKIFENGEFNEDNET